MCKFKIFSKGIREIYIFQGERCMIYVKGQMCLICTRTKMFEIFNQLWSTPLQFCGMFQNSTSSTHIFKGLDGPTKNSGEATQMPTHKCFKILIKFKVLEILYRQVFCFRKRCIFFSLIWFVNKTIWRQRCENSCLHNFFSGKQPPLHNGCCEQYFPKK